MSSSVLIQAVRKKRALWDPNHSHYHNRLVITQLWKEVASEIGANVLLTKNKWRGLRDYYRQQLRRNGEHPESQINSNWVHFDEMSFIGAAINPRIPRMKEEPLSPPTDLDVHDALDKSWQEDSQAQQWPEPMSSYKRFSENEVTSNHQSEDDDDLHFFKSIVPDLRGLSRPKKILLRLKIQQLIYDEIYNSGNAASENLQEGTAENDIEQNSKI